MLLNNILDKVVTMFCRPNLQIQKLSTMAIFRAASLFTAIEYSSKVSNVAIFLSSCKQTSFYFLITLLVEESQRSQSWSQWKSRSKTLLSKKKNNLKRRNITRKWIEKIKKSGACRHHRSFNLNSKLSWSISS